MHNALDNMPIEADQAELMEARLDCSAMEAPQRLPGRFYTKIVNWKTADWLFLQSY